jgi:hypothetical protein
MLIGRLHVTIKEFMVVNVMNYKCIKERKQKMPLLGERRKYKLEYKRKRGET